MKKATMLLLLTVGCLLGGCATSYEMAAVGNAMAKTGIFSATQRAQLEKSMSDKDIAKMLDVQVKAKLPTSLAVARLSSPCSGYQPKLEIVDGEELAGWTKTVAAQPAIRDVRPISHLSIGGTSATTHSLRSAAARQSCELLLVYIQADTNVDNFNDAAALYWTGVGLWLAPGNALQHKTVMQGVLIDCRTGLILGTATGSKQLERVCTAAMVGNRKQEMARETPPLALTALQEDFTRTLGRTVAAATASRQ